MLSRLHALSVRRLPWIVIAFLAFLSLLIAHGVFQKWLFMAPCEQCVLIRFAFLLTGLGAMLVAIAPTHLACHLPGLALSFYGLADALTRSLELSRVHTAMHSDSVDAIFGLQGCSGQVHYPFGLPLDRWFADWFAATGECGLDAPIIPAGVKLEGLQAALVNLYTAADGWYLIPSIKWLNMADCCAIFACLLATFLTALGLGLFCEKNP